MASVFFGASFAPSCVYAQKKNPIKIWRQGRQTVSFLNQRTLQQVRRASAVSRRGAVLAGKGGVLPSVSSVPPSVSRLSELTAAAAEPLAPLSLSFNRTFSRPPMPAVPVSFPGKETVDAVIFDLDGTLLDSLSAWEHSGTNFLRTQGITPPEGFDEILVKMSLMDGARLIKERFALPQSPEEILRLTLEPVRRRYFETIAAKPGVPETLYALKAQGVKLCIATASDRELAEAALSRLGLLDMFDFIITCDEVGVGKREPVVYEEALRRLGTSKSRTLVAEDAWYALETAKKAGFLTAGVADLHTSLQDAQKIRLQADYYVAFFGGGVFKK